MSKTRAKAYIRCPDCDEQVRINIPVTVEIVTDLDGSQSVRAEVDQQADYSQPMWDHMLHKHGPEIDL
jgi:hypothetical protein